MRKKKIDAPKEKPQRAAIYLRVSTAYQVDRDSLPMQRKDLVGYCEYALNISDYTIFEDAGYSGKNTDRPAFQKMMMQIRNGMYSHLLVWKIDRISRNLLDFAQMYEELKTLGVTFISRNEQFDTSTAMGEAMLKMVLIFAELERKTTAERVTATMISRANDGTWNGGRVPFGYDYNKETQTFSVNGDESFIVLEMYDLYEKTDSLVHTARELNDRGYVSRQHNPFSPVSVWTILRNPWYIGTYRYNYYKIPGRKAIKDESEWVTVENHHVAIIPKDQKERIMATLDSNSKLCKQRNIYKSSKHTHVFGGLIYCGSCGKPLGSTPGNLTRDGWHYSKYTCPTRRKSVTLCTGKSTSDPIIGEFVFNYILNMLNAQNDFDKISSPEELEKLLLIGDTFAYIDHIESNGLNDLFNVLSSGTVKGAVFGKGASLPTKKATVEPEVARLRNEKQKTERALDRLRSLYLYADEAMSEAEYMIQKNKLEETLEDINDQIGMMNTDSWQQSVSDEEFIQRASEFIIAQKLSGRKYVNYKRLAMSVDSEVLKNFVVSIIDSITIQDGLVSNIVFKNGLCHTFIFR